MPAGWWRERMSAWAAFTGYGPLDRSARFARRQGRGPHGSGRKNAQRGAERLAGSIQAEGLVGDKYIEVSFGSKDAPAVHDGDTIAGQPPLEMSQLFQKTNGILDQVQMVAQNLEGTSKNMEDISGKINNCSGTVGALVNNKSLQRGKRRGASLSGRRRGAQAQFSAPRLFQEARIRGRRGLDQG